jgi:UDP-glucose:(heptosyl)LPS alpha-1,3-glucosyltransferase
MRLALICRNFNAGGGVSRDAFMFAGALRELGVDIECYCDPSVSTPLDGVTLHAVESIHSRLPERFASPLAHASFSYRATRSLKRNRARYDVVYTIGTDAWEADVVRVHAVQRGQNKRWPERAGRSAKGAALRARISPVTRPLNGVERVIQRRQFAVRSRRLVAVADEVQTDLQDMYGVPENVIDVIPCPIDFRAIRTAATAGLRERLNLESSARVVLFIGNDFDRKGLDEAIRVVARLDRDAHLVVVGFGHAEPFRGLAKELGVAARVHFLGHATGPEPFLRDADVLLLPTREDVWGTILIEAMAAGVPIVTTAIAGAAPVIAAAGAGFVVSDYTTDAFTAPVARLLDDAALRRQLGGKGVGAAEAYDAHRMAPKLYSILERAVGA